MQGARCAAGEQPHLGGLIICAFGFDRREDDFLPGGLHHDGNCRQVERNALD